MGIQKLQNPIDLLSSSDDEQSPIRVIFCLKNKTQNMKTIEDTEDCFILDFDPSESPPPFNLKLSESDDLSEDNDNDLCLIFEKGQVACRDYPHPRHLCANFPFEKTPHQSHCQLCYCYICETTAPCKQWSTGSKHCDVTKRRKIDGNIWQAVKRSVEKA